MLTKIDFKKFIDLCKQKPYKDLCDSYIVDITTPEQFFRIIIEALKPNSAEQILFLKRHEKVLNKNNLYSKIIQKLDHHIQATKSQIDEITVTEKFIEDAAISTAPFAMAIGLVYPSSVLTTLFFAALCRVYIIDTLKDEITLKETCLNELKKNLPEFEANVSTWTPSLFNSTDQQASNQEHQTTTHQKQAFSNT